MAQSESDPFWKFLTGLLLGIGMTWGYVRFGFQLPGLVQLPAKMTSAAISITADHDLENWELPLESRQRAAAVILGQNPEQFSELDNGLNQAILTEMLRLKAVRRAKLAKAQLPAYDKALEQSALREMYEQRYHTSDVVLIKQKLLERDIAEDALLRGYLAEHWPEESLRQWSQRVRDVSQSELRPARDVLAAEPSGSLPH